MYKSKLQELCQKSGLTLPVYTSEKDGPDHCPRFSATVTVNGTLFQTPQSNCRSSKEAQNSAAKVAFEFFGGVASVSDPAVVASPPRASITVVTGPTKEVPQQINRGNMQSNDVNSVDSDNRKKLDYKSKLQELCQKRGLTLPVYTSVKEGPDHCPRFTATVTVNGTLFQTPQSECRSSKEAQNLAAKVAFELLSRVAPGFSPARVASPSQALSTTVVIDPTKEVPQHINGGKMQSNNVNSVELHSYKKRLQQYVQKNHFSCPSYTSEFDGPPHCRRFKATVTIDGRTYQCSEHYPTMKDAEHAAAKAALASLSNAEIVESDGFSKSLLQELVHKEGYQLPSYSTNKSGPSHNPTFVSAVQVGEVTYHGEECKTKKQSEMSAAKVAYEKLINLKVAPEELGKCIASSQDASRKIADENCQNIGYPKKNLKRTSGEVEGCSSIVTTGTHENGSAPVLECGVTNSTKPAEKIELQQGITEGIEENAKRYKSSREYMNHPLPAVLHPSPPLSNDSCSEPDEKMKRVEAGLDEASGNQDSKILISRYGSDIEVPEGVSVVHDAEGWKAVKMNPNQDEQV